jgi:hypothetical protein
MVLILLAIAISILSGEFADVTGNFFQNHAIAILLVSVGILYYAIKAKSKK